MNDDEKNSAIEIAEVGLDALLDEGLLKDIPYLSTLYTLTRSLASARDRLFAAKIRRFLSRAVELTPEEKKKLADELEKSPSRKTILTEVILLSLDKADRLKKADLLGVLFTAHIRGAITEAEFDQLAHAVTSADVLTLFRFFETLQLDEKQRPKNLPIGFESLIGPGITRGTGTPSTDSSGTFTRATDLGFKLFTLCRHEISD